MSLGLFSVPFSFLFFASNGLRWVYEFYAINLFCSSAHPSPHLRILTRCFVCLPTRTASIHIRPFSLPISFRVRHGRHDHDLQVTTTLHLFRIHIPGIYTPRSYPLTLYPYISLARSCYMLPNVATPFACFFAVSTYLSMTTGVHSYIYIHTYGHTRW